MRLKQMKLRIEIAALIFGLVGSGISFALGTWWGSFPVELREFLRGGDFGGKILGRLALVGLAGIIFMVFNLITGERKLWWLRILGFLCFLFLSISFGLAE